MDDATINRRVNVEMQRISSPYRFHSLVDTFFEAIMRKKTEWKIENVAPPKTSFFCFIDLWHENQTSPSDLFY